MDHKLQVTVQVDPDQEAISLRVGGCLTTETLSALCPLIQRAFVLKSAIPVTVDLLDARHVERSALDMLEQFCRAEQANDDSCQDRNIAGTIDIIIPKRFLNARHLMGIKGGLPHELGAPSWIRE